MAIYVTYTNIYHLFRRYDVILYKNIYYIDYDGLFHIKSILKGGIHGENGVPVPAHAEGESRKGNDLVDGNHRILPTIPHPTELVQVMMLSREHVTHLIAKVSMIK